MSNSYNEWGDGHGVKNRLKEIRMKEYIVATQTEFAAMLKIDQYQYSRYEKNQIQPSLKKALEIIQQLNNLSNKKWTVDEVFYLE